MVFAYFKNALLRVRDDTRGSITIEAVITLPLLFLTIMATYEFFEVHRYKSIREKATYTIADLISRETTEPGFISSTYLDNTIRLFDDMANDRGVNQLRVSAITFNVSDNDYEVQWSKVRGTGSLLELENSDVAGATNLPAETTLTDGKWLIVVESQSAYNPVFNMVFSNSIPIATRSFTGLRTASRLCYDPPGGVCPQS